MSDDEENSQGKESLNSTEKAKLKESAGISPARIFSKKLKHEKMGYMENRRVLTEEAHRLDRGEEVNYKKPRDKTEILSEKLSSWMVKEIQDKEVNKTALGKSTSTGSALILQTTLPLAAPSAAVDVSTSIMNFDKLISPGDLSPNKILPYDDFFQILQQYNHESQSHSPVQNNQSPYSKQYPKNADFEERSQDRKEPLLADNDALENPPAPAAKINLIQHLQQTDEQFNAYLKIAEGEQLSTKLLARLSSNLAKPRKARKIIPLGKEAMSLTDSRGRASKIASKGFPNIFGNTPAPPTKESPQHDNKEEDLNESDILTRLLPQHRGKSIFSTFRILFDSFFSTIS